MNPIKSLYFLSSRLWYFLTEIPLVLLLAVTLHHHDSSQDLLKFYPLEILTVAAMVAVFLFFFRTVTVRMDEVRRFSSFGERDGHTIEEGEELVLLFDNKGYLQLTVEGEDVPPDFAWCQSEKRRRVLFRARITFPRISASAILSLYGFRDCEGAFGEGEFRASSEYAFLLATDTEHGRRLTITVVTLPKKAEKL